MPYVIEDNLTDVVLKRWNDLSDPRAGAQSTEPHDSPHGKNRT